MDPRRYNTPPIIIIIEVDDILREAQLTVSTRVRARGAAFLVAVPWVAVQVAVLVSWSARWSSSFYPLKSTGKKTPGEPVGSRDTHGTQ